MPDLPVLSQDDNLIDYHTVEFVPKMEKEPKVEIEDLSYAPFELKENTTVNEEDQKFDIKLEIGQGLSLDRPNKNVPEILNEIKQEPKDYEIDIKEELISPCKNEIKLPTLFRMSRKDTSIIYKPLESSMKKKEFTGFSLFCVQQRKIVKDQNPKAHYMEVQHTLRKNWIRLTCDAKRNFAKKADHINQERACKAMLIKIKEAFHKEQCVGETKTKTGEKSKSLDHSTPQENTLMERSNERSASICKRFGLRPRMKNCSVVLYENGGLGL